MSGAILLGTTLMLFFGGLTGTKGSGRIAQEARSVGEFSGIEISRGLEARVTIGPQTQVRLEGDDNLLPLIVTEVRGDRLVVGVKRGHSIRSRHRIRVTVVTPNLVSIDASGGSRVKAEASPGPGFSASASGGSDLEVTGIRARSVQVDASGGSDVTLDGDGEELEAEASGGATVRAEGMAVRTAEVDGSGGSDIYAHVLDSVTGDLSGGSDLHLKGDPRNLDVDLSGGARIRRIR